MSLESFLNISVSYLGVCYWKQGEVEMNRALHVQLVCVFLCVLFFLPGCSGKRQVSVTEKERKPLACIAVIPAKTPINVNENISFQQAQMFEKGAFHVDTILKDKLSATGQFRFVTQKQMDAVISGKTVAHPDQLRLVAKTLSCNVVLTTHINRYRQRVGGAFSVDSAASATIQMKLISIVDGRVLWEDVFHETQQPLFSNLLGIGKASRRGFKWITVEELTRSGVEELLEGCPYIVIK